ncbi:MAG: HD domain-containing protein [Thermoplasmata archaeon]|nr:MAG: HD domain-containing protein [Thermoplasmata archaeon]
MHRILLLAIKAGKLKGIKRKGWLRIGIEKVESVACHSYRVAFLAMLIGDALNLNVEKMLKMALLHDLAEATTGDITPYDMKREKK